MCLGNPEYKRLSDETGEQGNISMATFSGINNCNISPRPKKPFHGEKRDYCNLFMVSRVHFPPIMATFSPLPPGVVIF